MKFSIIDQEIESNSFNPLDLVSFDEIKNNIKDSYPAFIIRGSYIKTITKVPWVDFFNLPPKEQEEKVNYWWAFLSSIKTPTQVMIHSVPIETDKYLEEVLAQVEDSPFLTEKIKKEIKMWLPSTLACIKRDWETTPYKKEYYIITSCKIHFNWENLHEIKEDVDDSQYTLGSPKNYTPLQWKVFEENFNWYYNEILGLLLSAFWEEAMLEPLTREEDIIGLFAEINNGIDRDSIPKIQNLL